MRTYDIIKKKRDGKVLSAAELKSLIDNYTKGEVADYQMAAFAMAVFFQGMDGNELSAFTEAMLRSGDVLDLSETKGRKVDKHSTGGVGDKISLPLAPAVASCGVPVPMISGRGLGHTGGTLDKLESIPGFNVNLDTENYRRLVREIGCCLIGQTADLAPADKKLYALRDVTATVDCMPLIASSIMSKKLAEGIDGLVLDVKYGSGAFMKELHDAEELARTMVDTGTRMGKEVVARLTYMGAPLGRMVGNALEVQESLDVLDGGGPDDVVALTVELGAEMLVIGQVASDVAVARAAIKKSLSDGTAREKFGEIIEAQGGDRRVLDDRSLLPSAPKRATVVAPSDGFVSSFDCESVGIASMLLGGGRQRSADAIDPRVGVEVCVALGDEVRKGDKMFIMHVAEKGEAEASARLLQAVTIDRERSTPPPLFGKRMTASDI